jgi:hypothetical protein
MAISDLHGNLEGLDPSGADVVVLAGDIAPLRGRGVWHVNDQKKWINKLNVSRLDENYEIAYDPIWVEV